MGLPSVKPINITTVGTVVMTDRKKGELEFSYWLTLQNRVLNHGFVTVTTNPENGKQLWKPTPRGVQAYKTILGLTSRSRLFRSKSSDNT